MLSYTVYKVIHYLGVFTLVSALSASLGRAALVATGGGSAPTGDPEGPSDGASASEGDGGARPAGSDPWRKRLGILHGLALFLVLLGGFGMLARLGVDHGAIFPGWIWVKLGLWLVLGGLVALRRSPTWAVRALVLVPLLAFLAGYVAFTKPF